MRRQLNKKRFCRKKDENDLGEGYIESPGNGLFDLTCRFCCICHDDFSVIAHDHICFLGAKNKQVVYSLQSNS